MPRVSEQVPATYSAASKKTEPSPKKDQPAPATEPPAAQATTPTVNSGTSYARTVSAQVVYSSTFLSISPAKVDGTNGWYRVRPTVKLFPSDGRQIYYKWSGDAWHSYSSALAVPDGRHFLNFYSHQPDGSDEMPQSRQIMVDPYVPSVPTGLHVVSRAPDKIGLAWDAATDSVSGVLNYEVYQAKGTFMVAPIGNSVDVGKLNPSSSYTFIVRTVDVAGNRSDWSKAISVKTPPPTTQMSVDPASPNGGDGWYSKVPTITLSSDYGGATSLYAWDGGAVATYTAPFGVGEGQHELQYCSVDASGNAEASHTADFKVDLTPPDAPTLAAAVSGADTIHLTWPKVTDPDPSGTGCSGLDHYTLFDLNSSETTPVSGYDHISADTTDIYLHGLSSTSGHHYALWAYDCAGNGSESNEPMNVSSVSYRIPLRSANWAAGGALSPLFATTSPDLSTSTWDSDPPAPPAGWRPIPGTCFDVWPHAPISGPVTIVLNYDPSQLLGAPANIRMMHFHNGQWIDVTTGVDASGHQVSGSTDTFSPFELFEPEDEIVSTPASSWQSLLALGVLGVALVGATWRRRSPARS